jgi:predicted dithiol-disulfide oxidoreductase (DUF899 family)
VSIRFPGESASYRAARERLLDQEVELRRSMEAVAAARRELPPGGPVPEDYVFEAAGADGSPTTIRLSELFAPGTDSRALLSLEEGPCPSCVALLDQLDGAAEHAGQWVIAKAPLDRLLTWADERGWRNLRLMSSAGNSFSRDYFGETDDGSPMPMLNMFEHERGTARHFWGAELTYAPMDPGQDHRSVGTLEPLWNMFDLTRAGRPDWDEQLEHE